MPNIALACERYQPERNRFFEIVTALSVLFVFFDLFLLSLESKYWDRCPSYDSRYVQKSKRHFLPNDKGNIHIRTHFSLDTEWTGHHLMQHRSPASFAQGCMTMTHKHRLLHPLQKDTVTLPSESRCGSRMDAELHQPVHPIPHPNHGGAPKPNAGTQQGPSPRAPLLAHSKDSN